MFGLFVYAPLLIASVSVHGTNLPVHLTTQVGQFYNAATIHADVRNLWNTGRFADVRVESAQTDRGNEIVFRVIESPRLRLHKLVMEPSTSSLRLSLPEDTPLDHDQAQRIALEARKQLRAEGYPNAQVEPEIARLDRNQADLRLRIESGDRLRVKRVEFEGEPGLDPRELRGALRALRVRRVLGWRLLPVYSAEAVDADLARIRSLYFLKGYFDASVRLEQTEIQGKETQLTFRIASGPLYQVRNSPLGADLCSCLLAARRDAEREGILDFNATLNVESVEDAPRSTADLTTRFDHGESYRVGRIQFVGNHHYSDATLRRNLQLEEGQLFDEMLLRESIERLNGTRLFEPLTERDVAIYQDESSGTADVRIQLTERKRGAWNISGPLGPASFAGPFEASISSRLPSWGSGLLQLSTYTVSLSMFAFARPIVPLLALNPKHPLLPVLALGRPFMPSEGWRTGFSVVPQLGWRAAALSYSVTQIQQRTLPVLSGNRGLVPEFAVKVTGLHREDVIFCDPQKPRLASLRIAAALLLRAAGMVAGF